MTHPLTSGTMWMSRRAVASVAVVLAAVVVAFALLVGSTEQDARAALDRRFEVRATLTADFAHDFVADLAQRERSQAERLLADPTVTRRDFEQVVHAFDFEAAVLLDGDGRLLQVWPARPEIIGQDMSADYAHLRTAVGGEVGVSNLVPAAATETSITAVAVPFDTSAGRRVFSGAFSPATAPIGAYLNSVVPVAGGHGFLVDADGKLLAGEPPGGDVDAFGDLGEGLNRLRLDGVGTMAMVSAVAGTPWRVVLTTPSAGLHAPVEGGRSWAPRALVAVLAFVAAIAVALLVQLGRARAAASSLSQTDDLTQLPNRRAVATMLREAIDRNRRSGFPMAVLVVDLDLFKSVNDTYGHEVGDSVLQAAAGALRSATRDADIVGRWGGEEFLAILSETDRVGARAAGERVRRAVAAASLPAAVGDRRLTASVGIALLDGHNPASLVARADAALYRAKDLGRDRVVLDGDGDGDDSGEDDGGDEGDRAGGGDRSAGPPATPAPADRGHAVPV